MPPSDDVLQYLPQIKKITMFCYLGDDQLDHILQRVKIVRFSKGETIVTQGDISQYLFAIIKGKVHVSFTDGVGKEIFICDIHKGEVFGEAGMFMAEKRMANVISAGETIALRLHRKDMITFIRKEPHAGNKILMLIVYSLLNKLRSVNRELAFEKQAEVNMEYMDSIIQDFMTETDTEYE